MERSVDDMLTYPSHPQSDLVNTWDRLQMKDQHDNKMGSVNAFSTGQRCQMETSVDWKPLKWNSFWKFVISGFGVQPFKQLEEPGWHRFQ